MGMDVYGKAPTSEVGAYFRNNVWWWRPLWNYCVSVAPDLAGRVRGHSNDGDGLTAKDAITLAKRLQAEIDTGATDRYAAAYEAARRALPQRPCEWCAGTGIRTDEVGVAQGFPTRIITELDHPRDGQVGWCNGCNGTGRCEAWDAYYPFSVENVQEFVHFLRASGGFEIC